MHKYGCFLGAPKGRPASRRRRWGWATHAQSHGPLWLRSKRMGARRLALVWRVWALAQHAQPFGCDLVSVASAYKPPSSNHLQRGLHAANGATAAGVVDPTSSGNEVSVELSVTQRSDPRFFHEQSSTSGMMVPKQEAHVTIRDPRQVEPTSSRHVGILPRRIKASLSRCVKTHGLRTVSGAGVVSLAGSSLPIVVPPLPGGSGRSKPAGAVPRWPLRLPPGLPCPRLASRS